MKPQKQKEYNSKKSQNKWNGYYIEDIDCKNCLHWKGKKRGCSLSECGYEDEKLDAIKSGRVIRKRGL